MKTFYVVMVVLLTTLYSAAADFRQDATNLHNELRNKHHVSAMSQDKELNNYAQTWAQHLADTNTFRHSGGSHGENLYMSSSTKVSDSQVVADAIKSWYSEVSHYDFNNPRFNMGTGHFTQIVWKDSKTLGIGVARSSRGTYVCASYDPPGNFIGAFEKNVFRA